jgi:hypothetical protein
MKNEAGGALELKKSRRQRYEIAFGCGISLSFVVLIAKSMFKGSGRRILFMCI